MYDVKLMILQYLPSVRLAVKKMKKKILNCLCHVRCAKGVRMVGSGGCCLVVVVVLGG